MTFSAGAKTVVRSAGSWIDDGFLVGRASSIFGSASNNRSLPIVTVTALTLTLDDPGNLMVTEGPVGGCSAHSIDGDTESVHFSSSDGATWTEWEGAKPWGPCHAQAAIASSDGIYLTSGFESDNLFVIREETGPLVSKWEDLHAGSTVDLEQATDAKKPMLVANAFGGKPGIVASGGQIMKLTTADVDIAAGGFEAWAIVKSLNFDESNQGCIVVGSRIGAGAFNVLNLLGAKLQHAGNGDNGTPATSDDDLVKQDVPHLIGVQFYPAFGAAPAVHKLFVDGVLVADSGDHPTFSNEWTGWQSIFAGNTAGSDSAGGTAALAMGALVIRKGASAPWDAAAVAKLSAWSRDWGVAP